MSRKDIIISIGVLLTCISVIIGGYLIGKAIKEANTMEADNNITSKVMDLPMVADYLNMTQGEVRAIIRLEEEQISEYGSFTGKMFPYFTIDDKQYFYRDEIDQWLMEVVSNHRIYDTDKGYILQ